uniref:Uncharacterized protein n=1 Tax=Arundo donax TaxID=35708 RepID=A0A0A9HV94_ARUDO
MVLLQLNFSYWIEQQ